MTKKRVIIISIAAIILIASVILIFRVIKKGNKETITEVNSEEIKQYLDTRFEANISDLVEGFEGKEVGYGRGEPRLLYFKLLIKEGQEDAVEQIVATAMGKDPDTKILLGNSVDEYVNDLKNSEIISGYCSSKGGKHGESIWTWVNFVKIDGRYYMYFEE